ncbi:MAG: hypothetical protein DRJ60_04820 [Thermoprotei archaeon]|mgnify:CR=1 FL=1|nr:MAG: hypothetical protein DRJ60_04820 [Thermoprotei archaeon]
MASMFSIRLPKKLLKRMRERKDINWAEALREAIRRTLNEPILPVTIENLICSLRDSNEWGMLLCLYLKAELLSPHYVVRNLEIIYPGRATEIIDRLNSMLRERGIDPSLSGSFEGRTLRDLVKEGLLMYGVYDEFEKEVREKLSKENWDINKVVWLLSQYFIEDLYMEYEPAFSIEPHGFIRTLEIMLDKEDVTNIVNKLVKIGLVFWDYYSSRAYSHEMIKGADYARPIFAEFFTNKSYLNYSTDLLKDENFLAFLKWLSREYGLDFRAIMEYAEERAKAEFKGSKSFDEVLEELIKRGIVLIDYWPHRRRVGRRSSMPPHWIYKLTPIAKREILPRLLIEALSKLQL